MNEIGTARYLFYELEHTNISRQTWANFILTYVQQVIIRPWLVPGSMILADQFLLWHPEARYVIVLSADNHNNPPHEITETLIHELLYINLYVIGIKEHPEEYVEKLCKILAKKYSFIVEIFEEIFTGLKLDPESISNAFSKPVCVSLP